MVGLSVSLCVGVLVSLTLGFKVSEFQGFNDDAEMGAFDFETLKL
jgi:hypothetical protein